MLETAISSTRLMLTGKLFKNNVEVLRLVLLGAGSGALAIAVLSLVAPLWLAAIVGGAVSGAMQPYLLRHVKYA